MTRSDRGSVERAERATLEQGSKKKWRGAGMESMLLRVAGHV